MAPASGAVGALIRLSGTAHARGESLQESRTWEILHLRFDEGRVSRYMRRPLSYSTDQPYR